MVLVVHGGREDAVAAQLGEPVVVIGARLGAGVAVDGVGGAHLVAALGRARAGAAAAVHAAAELAVDRGGTAGTARAGAGAASEGKVEGRVAAGFFRGWWVGGGGG